MFGIRGHLLAPELLFTFYQALTEWFSPRNPLRLESEAETCVTANLVKRICETAGALLVACNNDFTST